MSGKDFTLPLFNPSDIDSWLVACDRIFLQQKTKPAVCFSRLVALLNEEATVVVKEILLHHREIPNPYVALKDRLRSKFMESKRERVEKAFSFDMKCTGAQKPSVFMDKINYLLRDVSMEDIKVILLLRSLPNSVTMFIDPMEAGRTIAWRADEYFRQNGEKW